MKIVHATAELFPYAKTGGLADVVGSLTATLADKGHDISVFLPGYREALENLDTMSRMHLLRLEMDESEVWTFSPRKNLRVFLICSQEFFDRSGIYGNDEHDFDDNHKRFMFFTKAVVKTMHLLKLYADVVHCHDWQTALLPMLLQHAELHHGVKFAKRTIFTIHNIAFQGSYPIQSNDRMDLPDNLLSGGDLEYNGQINMLKGGLLDTVIDIDEHPEKGTGITFPPTAAGFRDGLVRALGLFAEKPRLAAVQQRGMRKDFSWAKAAMAYERFYKDTLGTASSNDNNVLLSTTSCVSMAMAG